MRVDGSQIRRQSRSSGVKTHSSREAKLNNARNRKISTMARLNETDETLEEEIFDSGEEVVDEPKPKKSRAKKADPVVEEIETEELDVELLQDDDEMTLSLVNSINGISECFRSFVTVINYMDMQIYERKLKFDSIAEAIEPDTDVTER